MQKVDPLIRTKLRLPSTRPSLVFRPRLHEQVAQGLRSPLTLITAPAGFGKSTLVASVLAACGKPVIWLSLDRDDNQPGRFLRYLVAAMHEADPRLGAEAERLAAMPQQGAAEAILTSLVNDLDASSAEVILALDDYQFIDSQAVHADMAFLLEHCPATLHIVIASRSDPPLPLARLRARGQVVELRAADLSFTEPEAGRFLNDVMGLHLDAASVAALKARTEGWIAGLQMAALSMRDRTDVSGFIRGFSGTNRYILDYLLEEVLASQPSEIQRFLLRTSILERLTAPLCDALLADPAESSGAESAAAGGSAAMLEYLERANLFLVPLDDQRVWYRYHHLFADLLRTQLRKTYGEQVVGELHRRAAEWHELNGSAFDAIRHASIIADDEMVERLIEQNYMEMMNRGEMASVRSWIGQLSGEWTSRRPWLCLYEAFSRSWFGQVEEALLLLGKARERMQSEPATPATRSMQGYHDYVLSRVTAMQGDTRRAIELCIAARANLPSDNLALQIEAGITLGYEYFLFGDFANAVSTLEEMIRSAQLAGAVNNPVAAYCILARVNICQGRLQEAYQLLDKAAQLIQGAGGQYLGVLGLVEVGLAQVLLEWNDLQAALTHLKQGLELLPMWGKADDPCLAYVTLSRIERARGNRDESLRAVEKAVQLARASALFSEARSAVETAQVDAWLSQGEWAAIDRWTAALGEARTDLQDSAGYEAEWAVITRARVLLARHRPEDALRPLTRLEVSLRGGGQSGRLLRILILKALALQSVRDAAQADSALAECLTLAEQGGYVRLFLDEGPAMRSLLLQWLKHACPGSLREYAARLLSQFEGQPAPAPQPEIASAAAELVGSLSPRELEVLRLIAVGGTNQDIARQLIVSPGTVKAHTASIYRKLDVANRTQAVARARQLGLLP